jgi:hypothetical protein
MLTHLLAANPTMTPERGPLLECIDSVAPAALLPFHSCRSEATRSRAGGRLGLVGGGRVGRSTSTPAGSEKRASTARWVTASEPDHEGICRSSRIALYARSRGL